MNNISESEMKILNKVCLDIDSGKKNVDIPKEKQYIRGNTKEIRSRCPNCGKVFNKNNPWQITYFCSKLCRKAYREVPSKFEVVK
jgi:hypothetical protein